MKKVLLVRWSQTLFATFGSLLLFLHYKRGDGGGVHIPLLTTETFFLDKA